MQFPQIQIWVINKASGCLKLRQIFVLNDLNLNFIVCVTMYA